MPELAGLIILLAFALLCSIVYVIYRVARYWWMYHSRWKVVTAAAHNGWVKVVVKRAGDYHEVSVAQLNPASANFTDEFDTAMEQARVMAAQMNVNAGANRIEGKL